MISFLKTMRRRAQNGGSISDVLAKIAIGAKKVFGGLKRAHEIIKKNQLVSKGARHLGYDQFADKAEQYGYGRRRKRRSVRRVAVARRPRARALSM